MELVARRAMLRSMDCPRSIAARTAALILGVSTALVAFAQPPPAALAHGVYRDSGDPRQGALLAFAGWTVQASGAWTWLQALRPRVGLAAGALHCAVAGPQDSAMIHALAEVHAVYAVDEAGAESANAAGMRALHALAPERVGLRAGLSPGAGCNPKAPWCLHHTLVTRRPHDPQRFDLVRDYGQLGPDRPVQDGYLLAR